MSKLTTKKRKSLPSNEFGLPAKKKFPIEDRAHAANAKARAAQMVKKGKLSKANEIKIDKKANAVLAKGKIKK
jgi:hypothetical protein